MSLIAFMVSLFHYGLKIHIHQHSRGQQFLGKGERREEVVGGHISLPVLN